MFGLGLFLRRSAYRAGIKKSVRLDCPVISVGNLTAGGTGKTPCVAWVTALLQEAGARPTVLTRGYRGGDEAALLTRGGVGTSGVPVIVNPDRRAGAKRALAEHRANCLVLDDGFQHWQVQRDLDLVLIDSSRPFGGGRLLPSGFLREPLDALSRADHLLLTRCDQVQSGYVDNLRCKLEQRFGLPVAEACHAPAAVWSLKNEDVNEVDHLEKRSVWGLAGIGNPEAFRKTLETIGAEVLGIDRFPDHHNYRQEEIQSVVRHARAAGADFMITTEKDAMRLDPEWFSDMDILVLGIRFEIRKGETILRERILELVQRKLP